MLNTTPTNGKMTPGLSDCDSYSDLLLAFPPRPIKSEAELFATQEIVDYMIDLPGLTPDQSDYLNLLGTLIHEYEQQHEEPIPDIHGVELLKVLISENELRQKDLVPIFKTESIVSEVLNGRRNLTVGHIQELASFFHVSAVFFPIS